VIGASLQPIVPLVDDAVRLLPVTTPVAVMAAALTVPVKVGLADPTKEPLPVSSVTAAKMFALDGVASAVATPVPRPETPVEIGRLVALARLACVGVPRVGVVSVGEVANTKLPDPVAPVLVTPSIVGCPVMLGDAIVGELPKLVRLLAVTPLASVAPVNVPAAAGTVMLAVPSKLTPLIVRAVCKAVAVPAR
jgi:hypothetical protein